MSDIVLTEIEDGVATVTMNRPDSRNALTAEMTDGIITAVEKLKNNNQVRCLILSGGERVFCAGGDIDAMTDIISGDAELYDAVERIQHENSRLIRTIAQYPLPTVAKVDGIAYGGGACLAIAPDVTLASTQASISFGFREVGAAIDSGASYLLPREVSLSKAKELVFTGEMLSAEEAGKLGLFNHVYDGDEFDENVEEFVEPIATGPTIALRTSKKLLQQGLNTSLKDAIDNEGAAQGAVLTTHDHEEGAQAFMEGRDPEFQGF